MGDRGNVVVLEKFGSKYTGSVFLYSHWAGSSLPSVVRSALARKQRWDDSTYLSRIVFCEMVRGYESDALGFGISTTMTDNSHPLIVLDPDTQMIGFYKTTDVHDDMDLKKLPRVCTTSFADFINLKASDAERLGWDEETFEGWDKQQTVDAAAGERP